MDAQRALLDELMGAARNLTEEERKDYKEINWDDKEVCRPYMVRFCPHDLFVNTRSDLGVCSKIHDQKLKESFEKSPRHDAYVPKFEAELAQFCERLVMDLDRRVRRGRERLAQEVEPAPPPPLSAEIAEQLSVLEEKIKNLLEQAEALGEAGKVDEAEALMRKVDVLNFEKTALTKHPQNDKLILAQEKKMDLCEICGSFLVANDAAERTQSHVTGKQHIGYGMVRDFLIEYKAAKEKAREEERLAREKEAEERRKLREKEYENRGRRSSSGDRDRYRDRDRETDRHQVRDSDRERSRDRNGRGSRDGVRGDWRSRTGRDGGRDRYHDRSRSRSPVRRGQRSLWPIDALRQPVKIYQKIRTSYEVCSTGRKFFLYYWLNFMENVKENATEFAVRNVFSWKKPNNWPSSLIWVIFAYFCWILFFTLQVLKCMSQIFLKFPSMIY